MYIVDDIKNDDELEFRTAWSTISQFFIEKLSNKDWTKMSTNLYDTDQLYEYLYKGYQGKYW